MSPRYPLVLWLVFDSELPDVITDPAEAVRQHALGARLVPYTYGNHSVAPALLTPWEEPT